MHSVTSYVKATNHPDSDRQKLFEVPLSRTVDNYHLIFAVIRKIVCTTINKTD